MDIYFATNNQNKFREIDRLIPQNFNLLNLQHLNFNEEIPETGDTLTANAEEKARYIKDRFGVNCFADDTGLEVTFLNGMPGVYSARYAGENKSADDNIEKLLKELGEEENRSASFRTVICLILNDDTYFFEGSVEGEITRKRSGKKGFGYDPVFKPKGYYSTFAEMDLEIKNKISHRAIATKKLIDFLHNYR